MRSLYPPFVGTPWRLSYKAGWLDSGALKALSHTLGVCVVFVWPYGWHWWHRQACDGGVDIAVASARKSRKARGARGLATKSAVLAMVSMAIVVEKGVMNW